MQLAFLLLVASVGAPPPTPAQQQRASASMYRLLYRIEGAGTFTDRNDATTNVTDPPVRIAGVAFAVDPDGWLITARHAADPEQLTEVVCAEMEERYQRYRVDALAYELTLTDIVGNEWRARWTVTPRADTRDDVCHSTGHTVASEDIWPVRVVAVDTLADLALLKLTQSQGPVTALGWGMMRTMDAWHPVYAFQVPDGPGLLRVAGIMVRPCEASVVEMSATTAPGEHVTIRALTDSVSRYMLRGIPGMSGGPVIAGGDVVGVLVMAARIPADEVEGFPALGLSFAVPVDYVHAWYRWARGQSPDRPASVCENPFIVP